MRGTGEEVPLSAVTSKQLLLLGLSCHEGTPVALKEVLEGARRVQRERPPGGLDTVRTPVTQSGCSSAFAIVCVGRS